MEIKKIYIIGPSGSGKTTLGRVLCERFNIPHISLDDIAYPNQKERLLEERLEHVSALADKERWLTEGIYVDWTGELLEKADLIIWLDLPFHKTFFRVIKRYLVHKLRGDEKFGFKNTLKFVFNLRKYYFPPKGWEEGSEDKKTTRFKTVKALKPFQKKVVRIQNIKKLDKFLANLVY